MDKIVNISPSSKEKMWFLIFYLLNPIFVFLTGYAIFMLLDCGFLIGAVLTLTLNVVFIQATSKTDGF